MGTIHILFALLCLANCDFCDGMQISVDLPGEKNLALEVKQNDSVESLKKLIQDKEGTPIGRQLLINAGRVLMDAPALAEYDIHQGSTIELMRLEDGENFKLYVQVEFSLFVNPSDTIGDLKDKIATILHDKSMRNSVFDKLQHDQLGYLRDNKKTIESCGVGHMADLNVRIPHEDLMRAGLDPVNEPSEPQMGAVENSKTPNLIENKEVNDEKQIITKEIKEVPVVMYTKHSCRYCTMAKDLLAKAEIDYRVHDLDAVKEERGSEEAQRYLDELVSVSAYNMVPQVFICGKFIGGYTELARLHKADSLKDEISKCSKGDQ